ncbi:PDZ domain-containing protein [Virgibacillus subterraneus]|uniref:endopeptidase La n=2 Tax=Virgibacillus TaxID=84406 RepID=A0A1H1CGQ9_9BACI|nr:MULTISPECIES: SepM family pheromone-processing serine protease [Virgibacillus]SDQ63381.1 PDZ domain-containing protein [Virgibacillus salinus]SEQ61650.1 PDZ domain-containing protein [Virgibacillus subterraneus]
MNFTKKHIIYLIVVIAIAFFLSTYQLPYYVYKPGGADALNPIVNVEGGYDSKGDMHLVTVRGGQATPVQYLWAKVLPNHEIYPLSEVRPEGVSENEYFHAQLQMMESSQEASTVVAYKAADEDITINYEGVYVVAVVNGMPADGKLESGDRITEIDGNEIKESKDLINYVENKQAGDTINLEVERGEKQLTKEVQLERFKEADNKVGIGIRLVTDRSVKVDPKVNFSSGSIGGPSAGLMFSLEIYDQLTENDLTKGNQIAGTGEVDYNGNVLRIGGIDKKVIAADQEDCDIFFAPNDNGAEGSNYEVAKKTAEEIDTDMKIVPVDTFEDALNYLQNIESE